MRNVTVSQNPKYHSQMSQSTTQRYLVYYQRGLKKTENIQIWGVGIREFGLT